MNNISLRCGHAAWILPALALSVALCGCSQEQTPPASSDAEISAFKGDPSKQPKDAQTRLEAAPPQAKGAPQ